MRKTLMGAIALAAVALVGFGLRTGALSPFSKATTVKAASPAAPDAPAAKAPEKAAAAASPAVEAEFRALAGKLQSSLQDADDRKPAAKQAIAGLQAFIAKHAGDPTADKARLSLGNMQLLVEDVPGAIRSFQEVVDAPKDGKLAPMAALLLGKAQAQGGRLAEAQTTFEKLVAKEPESQFGRAAKGALAMLSVRPGQRPPSFVMRDLEGHGQSPEQYRGKVLLIDFWATWCGPCREEMPNVKRIYEKYRDRGFAVLGISLDTDLKGLKQFLAEEGITWPQICDARGARGELPRQMGVMSIPKMILIDREGVVRDVNARGPGLEKAVVELLKEPAPR